MSQPAAASRGSAPRTDSSRPRSSSRPCSSSPDAMRSRTVRARSSARPSGSRFGRRSRKSRQRRSRVADETERGEGGADPLLVRIDLDELPAELKRVLLRRLGAELRADDEHRVRALDELAGTRPRRRPSRRRARDPRGRRPCPCTTSRPERATSRQRRAAPPRLPSEGRRSRPRRSGRSAPASTRAASSSRDESGTTGAGGLPSRPFDSQIGLAREDVHRDLEEDRAARRCLRALPGLGEKLGNVLGASCPRRPLHDGLERRALVAQLVEVPAAAADQVARDLARDRDERDVRARGLHEAREGVQRSGAGGEEQGRRLAACARVAVGGEGGVQLGAEADVADRASA